MKEGFNKALDQVEMTYAQLQEIADKIVRSYSQETDNVIASMTKNIENTSNDELREVLFQLSLGAYRLGDVKDKSSFKADIAKTLRQHKYASSFNESEGTVAVRENKAFIESSEELLVEGLHDLMSSLLKTKLDEIHRVVDTIKMILTTRLSEAKLSSVQAM